MTSEAEKLLFAIYDEYAKFGNERPSLHLFGLFQTIYEMERAVTELVNGNYVRVVGKAGQDYYTLAFEKEFKKLFAIKDEGEQE